MIRAEVDASELRELELDLAGAPARVQWGATKTLDSSRRLVQRRMARQARGHRQLPYLQNAVTSEMVTPMLAEVGYETTEGTQGRLAHILLYGSVNNAPIYDFRMPLWRSMEEIVDKFGDMAEDAVFGVKQR